jgi:hypothetical protein
MSKDQDCALYLREKAATLRRLAGEHLSADHRQIAAKLSDVAEEWERNACELEALTC